LLVIFLYTLHLTSNAKKSAKLQNYVQEAIESFLQTKQKVKKTADTKIYVSKGLNNEIEIFFNALLEKFIDDWYSKVSQDSAFVSNIKLELAQGIIKIAERYRNVSLQ
jgi:PXA domain